MKSKATSSGKPNMDEEPDATQHALWPDLDLDTTTVSILNDNNRTISISQSTLGEKVENNSE